MKKIVGQTALCMTFCAISLNFWSLHARGGDAAVGALGGLAVGTMIGSAAASHDRRSSRAEQEAIRAQDKAEQVRLDQDRQRVAQLEREIERRDIERRFGGNGMMTVLIVLITILLLAVVGLGFFVFRRK